MHRTIAATLWAMLLAGCANATTTMLSEDTAIVRATGNSINDQERVVQASLKAAAQTARAHGFSYFVVTKTVDISSYGQRRIPGQVLGNETPSNRGYGQTNLGRTYVPGNTYTTPDRTESYIRPGLELTIRMYRQGEINPLVQGVWNAAVILGDSSVVVGDAAPAR